MTQRKALGAVLGGATALASILWLGCSPEETEDRLFSSQSQTFEEDGSIHVTVALSRAAIDQATGPLYVQFETYSSGTTLDVIADDAALDPDVETTESASYATIRIDDLAASCPEVGPCTIGATVMVALPGPTFSANVSVHAHISRDLSVGRFTPAATLTTVIDG